MSVQRRALMSAAALGVVLSFGAASAVSADSLLDAVAQAYRTNPDLQAQRANQRAIDEEYVQAKASFRPQLSVAATATVIDGFSGSQFLGDTHQNSSNIGLSATQSIWSGGRIATAVDAAQADILQGRETLRNVESQILALVIQAYVDVRRDGEALSINEQNVDILKRQLDQASAQFEVGEITRTDVAQAQARLAAAQAQLEAARAQLSISRAAYASVVGENPTNLAPEPVLPGVPASFDEAMDVANVDNPNLRAAQYAEQGTKARVASARALYRPSVSVNASYGVVTSPSTGLPFGARDALTASASLSVPLFTGGLNGSRVRQALERDNASIIGIDGARRQVLQAVSQAWARVLSTAAALKSNEEQVKADTIAAEGVRQEYQVGLRTTIDVLNAEQELRDAQLALVNSRHDNYVATSQLLAAMGRLEARNLVNSVAVYDPKANFDRVKNKGTIFVDKIIEGIDQIGKPSGVNRTTKEDAPIDTQLKAKVSATAQPTKP
jgi:outer membrane protein